MNTKELFLENEDLRNKLLAVTHADWFKQCLVFNDSLTVQQGTGSLDWIRGANAYRDNLLGLADKEDDESTGLPQPGLMPIKTMNSVTSKEKPSTKA